LLPGLLIGAIVAPAILLVGRETVLLFVVVICCCCFGVAVTPVTVGFVVVCCDSGGDDENTAVVGGVAGNEGFSVFGIPHIRDSVVLTTFKLWLVGSHIFALSSGDIVVLLGELAAAEVGRGGDDDDNDGDFCANT